MRERVSNLATLKHAIECLSHPSSADESDMREAIYTAIQCMKEKKETISNQATCFTVCCKMPDRWVDYFCSMLKRMEFCGDLGHSEYVGLYSDGDGDFRPKFFIDRSFDKKEPINSKNVENETFYDAG